jgi:hypothetical protein
MVMKYALDRLGMSGVRKTYTAYFGCQAEPRLSLKYIMVLCSMASEIRLSLKVYVRWLLNFKDPMKATADLQYPF